MSHDHARISMHCMVVRVMLTYGQNGTPRAAALFVCMPMRI